MKTDSEVEFTGLLLLVGTVSKLPTNENGKRLDYYVYSQCSRVNAAKVLHCNGQCRSWRS